MKTSDHLIVGAGVIGLSLAFELASRGSSVRIIEIGHAGRQTSWAAAGILPAVPPRGEGKGRDAFEDLRYESGRIFPAWIDRLRADTDIDPEFDPTGALHLASGAGEAAALAVDLAEWRERGLVIDTLTPAAAAELEPALKPAVATNQIRAAYRFPDESTIRTPRYLAALKSACVARGVDIVEQVEISDWQRESGSVPGESHSDTDDRFVSVIAGNETYAADQFCLATGVWSGSTAEAWDLSLDIRPWRGQMLLLRSQPGLLGQVINEGPNYLVPRRDGQILVGSTVEDVGFTNETTEAVIDELHAFAAKWIPNLANADRVAHWAGLRPGTGDGWPYLGRMERVSNAFVATGHFRSGVFLSPVTAKVMCELMYGEANSIDLADFRLERK